MVVARSPHRPLRGSRLSSFYPPIPAEGPSLSDLDSAFQLQEYISLLIRKNPHDVETIVSLPGKVKGKGENDESSNEKDGKGEVFVDEACWIYEHLRRIAQDLSHPLITSLQQECTRSSCPEMKAGEWLYLCVAHGNDGAMEQCCAIDYIIHTLDSATALLNSPRAFPSRLSIPNASIRHFSSLARRLGRIFAHAYFHHREAFENSEAESSLYARFLALTARFELVPSDFLVIPPRLYSTDTSESTDSGRDADPPRLMGASLHPSGGYEYSGAGNESEREGLYARQRQEPSGHELGSNRSWSPEKGGGSPVGGVLSSPRKMGRNRTDTMVYSDVAAFNEEFQRNAALHEAEPVEAKEEEEEEEDVHEQIQSGPPPTGLPGEEKEDAPRPPLDHDEPAESPHSKEASVPDNDPAPPPVPPPESNDPTEFSHVDELELVADSKELCEPHVSPSTSTPTEEPSEVTEESAPEPPSEPLAAEDSADASNSRNADDIELLLERKRVLDEAQAQAQAEKKAEEEDESKSEEFIVIGEQENDGSSDPVSPSSSEELVEAPEAEIEVVAESSPEPETKAEASVPAASEPEEAQVVSSSVEEDTEKEIDPNTTIEEDLHDVEKALQ